MGISIFVLSDLHAFDARSHTRNRPSFFDISLPEGSGADNPFFALKEKIKTDKTTVDYIVCCGDLADQANPIGLERAWRELQELKVLLGAKQILSAVGNHDVDSRHKYNDFDAKGVLLDLQPGFPFETDTENTHFWTHHFSISFDHVNSVRFVVLNSSAYHGGGPKEDEQPEYSHGRVSDRTLRRLKEQLQSNARPILNVLVCHHHPQKHDELKLDDYDDMQGGSELLRTLDSATYGPWLIFHGHKHHAKISYAQGGACSPIVFSAGSCAALPNPDVGGRNQVYIVDLPLDHAGSNTCCGRFVAWDWAPGVGWKSAQVGSGLPGAGGFGFRGDTGDLAQKIAGHVTDQVLWKHLSKDFPEIDYLLPSDTEDITKMLKVQYGIKVEKSDDGRPLILQK